MALYIFDTGPLIDLFEHYYPTRFPTLWQSFDALVSDGQLVSVREVLKEIESHYKEDRLKQWAKESQHIFEQPTAREVELVNNIFAVKHFRQMVEKKKLLKGGFVADPFVVARAWAMGGCVVSTEFKKENAAKIPNVCDRFEVDCTDLEGFMELEGWSF
jgi:hypothetical protein